MGQFSETEWLFVVDTFASGGWTVDEDMKHHEWWSKRQVILTRSRQKIVLTLLTDPLNDHHLSTAWAIGASHEIPTSRIEAGEIALLSLGRNWKTRLRDFIRVADRK